MSMKNSNDTNRNRTRNLLACSAVPQPTAPPRAPWKVIIYSLNEHTQRKLTVEYFTISLTKQIKVKTKLQIYIPLHFYDIYNLPYETYTVLLWVFFNIRLSSLHKVPFEILATQRLHGQKQIHLTVINVCLPKQILMSEFDVGKSVHHHTIQIN